MQLSNHGTPPAVFLVCALVCLLILPRGTATASQSNAAILARDGLARVDSLLNAGQEESAVREALILQNQLGDDPLYGWQITGRLGLALLRAGDPAAALPHLESVLRRHPNDPVAHRNFAMALMALGRKGRALSEFQIVVELAPDEYIARLEYGQVLTEFGDVSAAVAQLEVARHLCQDCLEPDRWLAAALMGAGSYGEAVAPLRRLHSGEPTAETRLQLAQALVGAGRDREFLDLMSAEASSGLSAREMNLVVEAEGRLGGDSWSLACLGAVVGGEDVPGGLAEPLLTDPVFWGRISLNLLESGRFQEGLLAADRAVELDPRNVIYRNNRVVLLQKLGRDDEAARQWAEVLELDPSLEKKESE